MENEIKEVYERYKHLDKILSDPVMINGEGLFDEPPDPFYATCYELWKVIKNENAKNKTDGE